MADGKAGKIHTKQMKDQKIFEGRRPTFQTQM